MACGTYTNRAEYKNDAAGNNDKKAAVVRRQLISDTRARAMVPVKDGGHIADQPGDDILAGRGAPWAFLH